jgi:uncharacterized damage-inducible protein DinB
MGPEEQTGLAFLATARWRLVDYYPPKIRRCLDTLSEDDVWWRPNAACNSVGNLILHLCGNVRQWLVSGVGGAADVRDRPAEFAERGPIPKAELLARLDDVLARSAEVFDALAPGELLTPLTVQGYDETRLSAIAHVVEHFSGHVGQIIYITKLRASVDLRFYDL